MNLSFVCRVKVHISMIVIRVFFQDNFVLNLVLMHEKILLNPPNHDLRFDIVFALNFDHYPDLIPIWKKSISKIKSDGRKQNILLKEVDKHLRFSLLELSEDFSNRRTVVKQSLFQNHLSRLSIILLTNVWEQFFHIDPQRISI